MKTPPTPATLVPPPRWLPDTLAVAPVAAAAAAAAFTFSWIDGMEEAELFHDCGSSVIVVSDGSLFRLTLLCLWWWCGLVQLREHDERRLFRMIGLPPDDSLLMRFGGGDGVEMRFAC
uniref:Uncharacterized protein n=1 Tax=Anopheles atroparvus TaxID=41427 RepID=A0A182JAF0_ANOAO